MKARGSRLREEGLGLEGWADAPQVCPGQPQGPVPTPTAAAGQQLFAAEPSSAHRTPLLPGLFAPNGKYFISIICEAPIQMTLTQHGKDLLPLDPTWQSGS